MIYRLNINVGDKRKPILKEMYLTADNDAGLYRRCLDQYRLQKEVIEIVDRINDEDVNINVAPDKRIGAIKNKEGNKQSSENKQSKDKVVETNKTKDTKETPVKSTKAKSKSKKSKTSKPKVDYKKLVDNMFSEKINGLSEADLENKKKLKWNVIPISDREEVITILKDYKTVKLYYIKTGAKKNKKYVILCKKR